MRKFNLAFVLSMCLLMTGCAFAWKKQLTVGAKGAKTKAYGQLESGDMLYASDIFVGLGWCKR